MDGDGDVRVVGLWLVFRLAEEDGSDRARSWRVLASDVREVWSAETVGCSWVLTNNNSTPRLVFASSPAEVTAARDRAEPGVLS